MAVKSMLKSFSRPRDAAAIEAEIAAIDAAGAARAQADVEATDASARWPSVAVGQALD